METKIYIPIFYAELTRRDSTSVTLRVARSLSAGKFVWIVNASEKVPALKDHLTMWDCRNFAF